MYKQSDRHTQYIIQHVIKQGDQDIRETCFRVILFRLFDRMETYEYLKKRSPLTWRDWDRDLYLRLLDQRLDRGYAIYGPSYQKPPPTVKQIGGVSNHDRHLRLLEAMMRLDLPEELRKLDHLDDMFYRISLYPSLGEFLGFQCDFRFF
jgi:hypothetical protein